MNGDVEKIAGLAEPTQQEAIKAIAATTQELMAAKESFRRVVEDKIGAEQAKLVGDGQSMNSPFSKVVKEDGSLDWSKIKITEDGDKAIIEIDGRVYHDRLIKIGSRWYINSGDGKSPEEMMKDANEVRDQANKMIAVMTKLEEGIRSGKITKTNFEGEYFGEVLKAVMGG
jgi:hypothetical protein